MEIAPDGEMTIENGGGLHRHEWKPTGTADTGHQPPRLEWECLIAGCDDRTWAGADDGPDWLYGSAEAGAR